MTHGNNFNYHGSLSGNYSNTKNNDHAFQNSTEISKHVFDNKI